MLNYVIVNFKYVNFIYRKLTSTTVLWDQELAAVLKPLCTERGHFSMCIDIYTQGNTHSNPRDFGSETNTQYECVSPFASKSFLNKKIKNPTLSIDGEYC